jgi:hypothetical protein
MDIDIEEIPDDRSRFTLSVTRNYMHLTIKAVTDLVGADALTEI